MKSSALLVTISLVLATAVAAAPRDGESRARDVQLIHDHIDRIFRAYADKDADTIRATHSAEWRGFLRGSPSILKGIDQYMAVADRALRSPGGVTGYEMREFDVVFQGDDLAVVPYVADMFVARGDQQGAIKLRVLDVYARQDGEWIQVGSNTCTHPESEGLFRAAFPGEREAILAAREATWRAYFAGDRAGLEALVPAGTIAIDAGEEAWKGAPEVVAGSRAFADGGGRMVSLEFPRSEIQMYGNNTAVVYSTYRLVLETGGERQDLAGRATEMFSFEDGRWRNTGWHLDAEH